MPTLCGIPSLTSHPDPAGSRPEGPPIVGRAAVVERLTRTVSSVGAFVVLTGPAGMGKTRLAREVLDRVVARGADRVEILGGGPPSSIPLGPAAHLVPVITGDVPLAGLIAATLDGLRRRASEKPLVVLLDDADLLDDATKALAGHLVGLAGTSILATTRRTSDVAQHLGVVPRDVVQLFPVEALTPSEVAELASWQAGATLARDSSAEIFDITGGNPLWVLELVRSARSRGGLVPTPAGLVVDTARAVGGLDLLTAGRVGAFRSEERRLLELVAVAGPLPLVLISGAEERTLLDALVDESVLEIRGDAAAPVVRFTHPLYRQAIRNRLGDLDRQRLLRELIARADPDTGRSGGGDRTLLLKLAMWHAELGEPFDPDALGWAAHEVHWGLLDELRRHLTGPGPGGDDTETPAAAAAGLHRPEERSDAADLLATQAWNERRSFDDGLTLAFLILHRPERADLLIHLFEDLRTMAADGAQAAMVAIVHGIWLHWVARDRPGAARLLEAAAAELEPPWRQMLESTRAGLGVQSGDIDESLRALEAAWPGDDAPDLAKLVNWSPRAAALVNAGRLEEGVALARQALASPLPALGHALNALEELTVADHWGRLCLGAYDEVATGSEAIADLLRDSDQFEGRALMMGMAARCRLLAGRPATAADLLEEAIRRHGTLANLGFRPMLHSTRAVALAWTGRFDEAAAEAEQAEQWLDPPRFYDADVRLARATVMAAAGHLTAAARLAETAAENAEALGGWYFALQARLTAARIDPSPPRVAAARTAAGHVDGPLPRLAVSYVEALEHGDSARLEELAALGTAMGEGLLAVEMLEAAVARHDGGTTSRNRLRAALAAQRSRCEGASSPLLGEAAVEPLLTRRELEVATLAARGLASPAIAKELTCSVRTVETHLYRVFAKLGINARSDLAAALEARTGPGRVPLLG